jgi:hypothetical protein
VQTLLRPTQTPTDPELFQPKTQKHLLPQTNQNKSRDAREAHSIGSSVEQESLHQQAQQTIEEARMVLPGIQALFGFQLMAVFNNRFQELTPSEQYIHFSSLLLVALAIALIMTPAAYHRLVERETVSHTFIDLSSSLIAVAMIPLMAALTLEVLLVGRLILGSGWASIGAAGVTFAVFAFLWFVYPFLKKQPRRLTRLTRAKTH